MTEHSDTNGDRRTERLLEELTNAPGPSGFEGPVRAIVRRELESVADSVRTDGIGSLIAVRSGAAERPRVLLSAHMDELGLMVRRITEGGFLKFQTLGGWLDQALVNQRWIVHTSSGPVPGITGIKTVHVMTPDARGKVFSRDGLFIDVGARDRADAEERLGVKPGDPVVPDSSFARLAGGDILVGKAWDDRAGVAAMVRVFQEAATGGTHPNELNAVATVQEEVGLRGAQTSSYEVDADIAINMESGVAGDYPGIGEDEAQESLGAGPSLFLHDSSMLPNLRLRDYVVDVARELGIPLQFNVLAGYGQDGSAAQRARGGIPVLNVAVPTRYLHSHNGLIDRRDVAATIRLVSELVRRLDEETVASIRSFE
ncbi:MAG: M42 family metallopeptidase [Dehalococcoidia bacterium]